MYKTASLLSIITWILNTVNINQATLVQFIRIVLKNTNCSFRFQMSCWRLVSQILFKLSHLSPYVKYIRPWFSRSRMPSSSCLAEPANNDTFGGCCSWDCPFQPYSSLLLSKNVNSLSVFRPTCRKKSKTPAVTRRSLRSVTCSMQSGLSSLSYQKHEQSDQSSSLRTAALYHIYSR